MREISAELWPTVQISDVSTINVGGTPNTDTPFYWGTEISWMNSGDLHRKVIDNIPRRITAKGLAASSADLIEGPSVAIGLVGQGKTRGTAALVLNPVSCSQSVALISPSKSRLDARYLYYNLDWRYEELRVCSAGSGRGVLSKPLLASLSLPLPDLSEQRRIAEVLDAVDQQIDKAQLHLEKMASIYDALVERVWRDVDHLIDREVVSLDDVATVTAGLTLGGAEFVGPTSIELPYLRVANVQSGYIDVKDLKRVHVLRSEVERFAVRAGDVLLTEGGDYDKLGRGALWDGRVFPCLHQNHIFRVRCRKQFLLPGFLALYTASSAGRRYFLGVAKQTTNLASINSTQLKAMPISIPPVQQQERLLGPVRAVQDERVRLGGELAKLRMLKQGLMDDLLTGKVRVTRSGELTG